MECSQTFDDINFYFGGEDFALTVSSTNGCLTMIEQLWRLVLQYCFSREGVRCCALTANSLAI